MHDTEGAHAGIKRRIATATASWARAASLAEIRASFDALFAEDGPRDFETFAIGTMPAAWIEPPVDANGRTILFCHGGGFQVGSIRSHLGLMRRLADAAEARVLAFEYRLAPEHKYPTAIEDASAAYRWLLDDSFLLAERARRYGVGVRVHVWRGMFHHFQMFGDLPESRESLIELGKFIMDRVPGRLQAEQPSGS